MLIVVPINDQYTSSWFYQMFQGWYNPRTSKFEHGLNLECAWYNIMGEEVGRGFTMNNFQAKNQANLTLEETSKGPH
jgi:hypothetical protein